jgi:hypothetical protein
MTAVRCDLTDLLVESCGHCTGAQARADREARETQGAGFTARYDGVCAGCGHPIGGGERIKADGDGGYLCAACS